MIALTDSSAALAGRNTYDEYGQPGPTNAGRFQYTGQVWLPEAQVYHYRARAYAPGLGRFLQTDPIGYGDGANLYNYVGADPVNFVDPFGNASCWNRVRYTYTYQDGRLLSVARDVLDTSCDIISWVSDVIVTGGRPGGGSDGGGNGPRNPPRQTEDVNCRLWEIGEGFGDLGGFLEAGGLLTAATGTVVGIGGAVTGYLPAAVVGAEMTKQGLATAAFGGTLTVVGETAQALAGDIHPRWETLAVDLSPLRLLPKGLLREGAKFIGGEALAAAIGDARQEPCQ